MELYVYIYKKESRSWSSVSICWARMGAVASAQDRNGLATDVLTEEKEEKTREGKEKRQDVIL